MSEALLDAAFPLSTLSEVGAALASLHAQSPAGLPPLSRETEVEQLMDASRNLGWVCPALAARAESLARQLAAELSAQPPVGQPIHGDFHIRQVILNDAGVTILDVDRAWCGDPMLDVGLFIAHLEREVIRGQLAADRVEPLTAALFDGYREATGQPVPARARLYAAVELARLAPNFYEFDHKLKPSVTLGYALGSGDDASTSDVDESFRQTGLQDNSAKFNGVTRLKYYGEVLNPELSNLSVLTAGVGIRPSPRSSIDPRLSPLLSAAPRGAPCPGRRHPPSGQRPRPRVGRRTRSGGRLPRDPRLGHRVDARLLLPRPCLWRRGRRRVPRRAQGALKVRFGF